MQIDSPKMEYPNIPIKRIDYRVVLILGLFLQMGCSGGTTQETEDAVETIETNSQRSRAKFEPEDGKCILMVGQELVAIGGLDDYDDGYLDHFDTPGGFVMYTNFSPGDSTFGSLKGNDGVATTDNWGDGDSNMSLQIADPDFKHRSGDRTPRRASRVRPCPCRAPGWRRRRVRTDRTSCPRSPSGNGA